MRATQPTEQHYPAAGPGHARRDESGGRQGLGATPGSLATVHQRYRRLKDLGDCHAAVGDDDRARACYDAACDLAPEESGPYVGLGVLALNAGRLAHAKRWFNIARHLDPACGQAYGGLAMVHHQSEDYPAAFEMYLKCLELDTNNLAALLGLFQTSCQMGTFAKIIHYLELFLETYPDDSAVLFCLATLHARDGRYEQAGRALRAVLKLEPDKIEAARLLAEVTDSLARSRPRQQVCA